MKKIYLFYIVFLYCALTAFAQVQSEGEKLFRLNKPEAAIPVLEKEISQPGCDPLLYNYLGLSYYQIKKYVQALQVFENALSLPYTDAYTLNLNAGNAAFALNDLNKALQYYSAAELADPEKGSPVLNKANTFLKLKRWGDAKKSYGKFIELEPENPQTPKIKILISLLDKEIEKEKQALAALAAMTEQLPDDVANLKNASHSPEQKELVEGKLIQKPIPPVPSEKVDGILVQQAENLPESEYVDANIPARKNTSAESEYIEENFPVKSPLHAESEFVNEEFPAKSAELAESEAVHETLTEKALERLELNSANLPQANRSLQPVQKKAVNSAETENSVEKNPENQAMEEIINEEQVLADREQILAERGKNIQKIEKTQEEKPDEIKIEASELDRIQALDSLECSVSILTEDFTPDNDGVDDIARFALSYKNALKDPESWELLIKDQGGSIIKHYHGYSELPEVVEWNGLSDKGEEVVYSAEKYTVVLNVIPDELDIKKSGRQSLSDSKKFRSGIIFKQTGESEWKITVMSFRFDGDRETFEDLTAEQRVELDETIKGIVRQLKKQPDAKIVVEGYANNISGTEKENQESLIPLSQKRAKVIMDRLIKNGIPAKNISSVGLGDKNPLAAVKDTKNWWKNRRVEFLIRKK